ncbi:PREDICTED: protein PAM68, chloroplastic [Theobroma cacao]|uniref:Protein PAM68, chloroplastic n=1 Tax=Theobroma cacao TaxID=3641 RepID=A0AB32VG05_THECC|nr:PREDICTED: protein PAM68, chloroplastic [Theobroma cacao]
MAGVALSSLSCSYKIDHGNEKSTLVCKLCRHVQINDGRKVEKTMESSSFTGTTALKPSSLVSPIITICQFPVTKHPRNQVRSLYLVPLYATLNSPRGFGPPPKKNKKTKKSKSGDVKEEEEVDDDDEEEEFEPEAGVIPEIVTNRMISRMGFSVGVPLFIGLLFFPFFYYLKVVLKIDVPTWVPFIVSFFFFGTALLGVSYGIVSSSWDPLREGSLLGWNEAQKNLPVFWQSIWGRSQIYIFLEWS